MTSSSWGVALSTRDGGDLKQEDVLDFIEEKD
jgi:hypothetical protein